MPSIGKDLVKIKNHLGLTIQDIQYSTKIPVHTLKKIEDDTIYSQSEEGPIYIRSFVRSYGHALKIEESILVKALNQFESGTYQHLLLEQYPDLAEKEGIKSNTVSEQPPSENDKETNEDTNQTVGKAEVAKTEDENQKIEKSDVKKADEKSISEQKDSSKSEEQVKKTPFPQTDFKPENPNTNVDWAKMGHRINSDKKPVSIWVIGLIFLVIILGIAGYFILESDYFSGSDPAQEEMTTPTEDSDDISMSFGETNDNNVSSNTNIEASSLDDILFLTVYAAFGNASDRKSVV